ncbi:hypothetical protein [Rhodobacter viridis]|nr:hypothetical protein [Rhodobacter viridis]
MEDQTAAQPHLPCRSLASGVNLVTSRLVLALLATAALTACGADNTFRLYPLSGPIADQNPAQSIPISITEDSETSGQIWFKLPKPNKTKCSGTWSSLQPREKTHERGLSLKLRDLGGSYKNSTKDVGGVNTGEVYAVCKDGTRLQGTFIMGSGTQSGTGTVTDTHGNSYKLLF